MLHYKVGGRNFIPEFVLRRDDMMKQPQFWPGVCDLIRMILSVSSYRSVSKIYLTVPDRQENS